MLIEGLCARITARIRTSAVWCSSCWLNWCHTCAPPRLQASESVSRRSSHVTSLWACWLCFGGAVAAAVSTAGVRAWPWRSVSPSSHRFAIRTTCTYTCAARPHTCTDLGTVDGLGRDSLLCICTLFERSMTAVRRGRVGSCRRAGSSYTTSLLSLCPTLTTPFVSTWPEQSNSE